jgi:hypothetical protein
MTDKPVKNDQSREQTLRENWEVMKPFVHFAFKAMAVIGGAVIGIIKLLPLLLEHKKPDQNKDKVIKI